MTRIAANTVRDIISLPFWKAVLLIFVGGFAATLGRWFGDNSPPVTIFSVRALNPIVAPGEILKVRYDIERERSCALQLDRVLFDGEGVRYMLEDLAYAAAPGPLGHDVYTVPIQIPRSFAKGKSAYRTVARYECNALHKLWPVLVRSEVHFETAGIAVPEDLPIPLVPVVPAPPAN